MCGLIILVFILPAIGAGLGYSLAGATGAIIGGAIGLIMAMAATVLPFAALVSAERRKSKAPSSKRWDVPWNRPR